jgi:murein DD-endopeptidase MepM/ murein hydrolase activator NlpD
MDVEEGNFVEKGDFVGEIGSTGFSTGPHLHWSISVLNTYVNTHQFIEEDVE